MSSASPIVLMMTATRARIAHDPAGESTLIDVLYLVAARMPEHKDLVIISCCSRDVQNAVKHFVTENLCKLLSGVIRTASIDTARNWTAMLRTKSRIHWLMKTAEAVDQATVKGVIGISNIPDDLVFWLIDYGVHPSYQQLLEAARGRASGVEHWAVLMVRKGVSHDIPQGVADMLCLVRFEWSSLSLSAAAAAYNMPIEILSRLSLLNTESVTVCGLVSSSCCLNFHGMPIEIFSRL